MKVMRIYLLIQERSYQDVLDSAELQKKLLDQAANLLKPGGHLVYSVCSPMPEEGELMTQNFLDQNPNFKIISAREILSFLPENSITESGAIATWPHLHDCDAFFAICLKKD